MNIVAGLHATLSSIVVANFETSSGYPGASTRPLGLWYWLPATTLPFATISRHSYVSFLGRATKMSVGGSNGAPKNLSVNVDRLARVPLKLLSTESGRTKT